MRAFFPVAVLLILTSPAAFAAPAAVTTPPGAKAALTLEYHNVPLRAALQLLFQVSGRQFTIEPAVPNYPMTVDIRDVPFDTALPTLLRLAPGVTYRKENDLYVIGLRSPVPVAALTAPGVVELDIPAAAANQMHIEADGVAVNAGEMEMSGDVRIRFGNGARLQTHGARVRVEKDASTGGTRIIVEPSRAAGTP